MQGSELPSLASRIEPSRKRQASTSSVHNTSKASRADLDQTPNSDRRMTDPPQHRASRGGSRGWRAGASSKRGRGGRPQRFSNAGPSHGGSTPRNVSQLAVVRDTLPGPLLDEAYIKKDWSQFNFNLPGIAPEWQTNPKSALGNYIGRSGANSKYEITPGTLNGQKIFR